MIHVVHNYDQSGPYPEDEIRQKLTSGDILPNDLAWKEGMSEWQPLANILHLQAETVPASQPGKTRRRNILIFSGLGCLGLLVTLAAIGAFGAMLIGIASKTVENDPAVNVGLVMSGYVEAYKMFADQVEHGTNPFIPAQNFALAMRSLKGSSAFSKCPRDFQQAFAEAAHETDKLADSADIISKSQFDRRAASATAAHEELGRISKQYLVSPFNADKESGHSSLEQSSESNNTQPTKKSDMVTDSELGPKERSALAMLRLAGVAAGAKFAAEQGRLPTKLEFAAFLAQSGVEQDKIEQGSPEEIRTNRRVDYEFRTGFEQGCRQALGIIQDASSPAF